MGHLLTDGKAVDITLPAGDFNKGDLYRVNQWNGICLDTVLTADTDRGVAFEVSAERIWKVKFPAALNPAVGDVVYWTAGAGLKKGDTDLAAAVLGAPVAKVLIAKNAAGYAAVRVLNIGV
jgi:uncharacterized secreted protein with C-terminal beta-propeller domain